MLGLYFARIYVYLVNFCYNHVRYTVFAKIIIKGNYCFNLSFEGVIKREEVIIWAFNISAFTVSLNSVTSTLSFPTRAASKFRFSIFEFRRFFLPIFDFRISNFFIKFRFSISIILVFSIFVRFSIFFAKLHYLFS